MNVAALVPKKMVSAEIVVGVVFLSVVTLLIVPVPAFALDLLLALSIGISAMVFLTALFSERPTDFSIFPTLLLIATLLRLSLNIASTRLILLHGHEGPEAAGRIIRAFSDFVIGGNLGVGVIIFLALVIINFVVITKGAGRIAEVAARFTLDAMPGKQMAIDAELGAGAIDEQVARDRRQEVEQQANFYGAMDGSSKFVRGDAIAGLIITAINLVGGIAIGIIQHGVGILEALNNYSALSIGDGLVSQMPALVVSTAAGLAISRASGKSEFGAQVMQQLLGMRSVLAIAAGFLIVVGLLPGLPFLPFGVLAGAMLFAFYKQGQAEELEADEAQAEPESSEESKEPTMEELLHVDALALEVGYGLLSMCDASRGGDVPARVKKLRRELAQELGVVVPPVRVVDNLQLESSAYVIKLYGLEVARATVMADRLMAIDSVGLKEFPGGLEAVEPVFGLKAFWINESDRAVAEDKGLTVVDPSTVLSTHLAEVLRRNADQLLGRDQVHELLGFVKAKSPKLVEELVPQTLSLGEILAVLRGLLSERVSIRNLKAILEAIALRAPSSKEVGALIDAARAALWRQITRSVTDPDGYVHLMVLEGELEHELRASMAAAGTLAPSPKVYKSMLNNIGRLVQKATEEGQSPCLVVADDLRRALRELLKSQLPDMPVIAIGELDRQAELRSVGTVAAG